MSACVSVTAAATSATAALSCVLTRRGLHLAYEHRLPRGLGKESPDVSVRALEIQIIVGQVDRADDRSQCADLGPTCCARLRQDPIEQLAHAPFARLPR